MAQVTIALASRACAAGLSDLFVFPGLDPGPAVSVAVFAMKPASRGSVRLVADDPRAPLAIDHGFLADPADAVVLAEGVERLRGLAAADPIAAYAGRELRPGAEVTAEEHVRAAARGFFHPVATCAIGRVVDGDGRVYGRDGPVRGRRLGHADDPARQHEPLHASRWPSGWRSAYRPSRRSRGSVPHATRH